MKMMRVTQAERAEMGELAELVRRQLELEFPVLRREQRHVFHLALNEAEALAWSTPVPLLVFPMLAYEKLKQLDKWNRRQKKLRPARPEEEIALAA